MAVAMAVMTRSVVLAGRIVCATAEKWGAGEGKKNPKTGRDARAPTAPREGPPAPQLVTAHAQTNRRIYTIVFFFIPTKFLRANRDLSLQPTKQAEEPTS